MADGGVRRSVSAGRRRPSLRRVWCCSFAPSTHSPEHHRRSRSSSNCDPHRPSKPLHKASNAGSFHSSPSPSGMLGLGIIDPRRILSPGRVSPIDSDAPLPEIIGAASFSAVAADSEPECPDPLPKERPFVPDRPETNSQISVRERSLDMRLYLKGKNGECLILELDSRVLCESSPFFAVMIADSNRDVSDDQCKKIELTGIEDVDVFKETIELMYAKDATRWLVKAGVSRAIDILEICATIRFDRGIRSCLSYIGVVPWTEAEEEKLRLFAKCKIDEAMCQDVLSRLDPQDCNYSDNLALRLIQSVTNATNSNARKEMRSLVSSLLSESSIYQNNPIGLSKERLYDISLSCLDSLVNLFKDAYSNPIHQPITRKETQPLIERVSRQVENLNWLLEILIDKEMAEDFVGLWANQEELISLHESASPMVRYELSRISASVFIALVRRRLQCPTGMRFGILRSWFRPMLLDFGWLQRCSKGLDLRILEESLGQVILTLTLKQQQVLFEQWFSCFARHGTECPNLSKAFEVWWRRSFVRTLEAPTN